MPTRLQQTADHRATEPTRVLGAEFRRLREDAGIPQLVVATRVGLSRGMLSKVEAGEIRASIGTLTALAAALGADVSIRLFPGAGVPIRDRFQARMIEALLRILHPRWRAHLEVPVQRPARGLIDAVLDDAQLLVAAEAQSDLRRLEAQLRWHTEKASGLAHTPLAAVRNTTISRLLILRSTRRTRELAGEFERTLRTAYPARTREALDALTRRLTVARPRDRLGSCRRHRRRDPRSVAQRRYAGAVTKADHDPGPEKAGDRAEEIAEAASEPVKAADGHEILIGTASWTDPTMTVPGVFYPKGADSAEERLQFYAGRFPLVEVDSTYYALPARRTAELWAERTPPDFTFDVKAHAVMTFQPTETKRLPKDIREALPPELLEKPRIYGKDMPPELLDEMYQRFADGLEPLRESGQLGAILLQYPRWWFPSHENRAAIEDARERLGKHGMKVTVEFRNGTWFNDKNRDRTLGFLSERQIPLVVVDEPQGLRTSVPPIVEVTSPELAIVRFHGRRKETWEARGVPPVERFRYLYSRDELKEWVPKVRDMASSARETHVLMNNCYSNYGSTNARELAALLQDLNLAD